MIRPKQTLFSFYYTRLSIYFKGKIVVIYRRVEICHLIWKLPYLYWFALGDRIWSSHSVWKSQKKSHSTLRAKRATFTFWVDKSWIKMPKMVHFGEFWKTWSLRSNSVTRHVSFKRTKIGGKCQNSNATFWLIFKQCELRLIVLD